jgi:hypothetical protein
MTWVQKHARAIARGFDPDRIVFSKDPGALGEELIDKAVPNIVERISELKAQGKSLSVDRLVWAVLESRGGFARQLDVYEYGNRTVMTRAVTGKGGALVTSAYPSKNPDGRRKRGASAHWAWRTASGIREKRQLTALG